MGMGAMIVMLEVHDMIIMLEELRISTRIMLKLSRNITLILALTMLPNVIQS